MNKIFIAFLCLAFIGQVYTVTNCNSNTDCTNFDGTNTLSCCYTLTGTSTTTGQSATQKVCDYTSNPTYPSLAASYGYKSVSGSCSSSAIISMKIAAAFIVTVFITAFAL